MRCTILFFLILLIPLTIAITGESITGNAPLAPTNVSVSVLPGPPVIYITSPQNTTYASKDILINYTISNELNYSQYNIDSTANISLGNLTNNSFSLNLPWGFHTIYFYANNSLGNSSKNIPFTIEEETTPPNNENPGGGDTPGVGGSSSLNIEVEPEILEVTLYQGESNKQSIDVKNNLNQNIELQIEIKDLEEYISLSQNYISLAPQQTQTILTTLSVSPYTIPDIYIGKLLINYGSFQKVINSIINVKERNALFDLSLELEKKSFLPGEKIPVATKVFNIKSEDEIGVKLYFSITDLDKNTVYEFPSENIVVKGNQTVYKTLFLPEDFEPGNYLILGEIRYNNNSAFSYETFSVGKKSLSFLRFIDRLNKGYYNIYLVIIFAVIAGIVFYLIRKIHREKIE